MCVLNDKYLVVPLCFYIGILLFCNLFFITLLSIFYDLTTYYEFTALTVMYNVEIIFVCR